jgi:hypothetical protein
MSDTPRTDAEVEAITMYSDALVDTIGGGVTKDIQHETET